MKRSHSEIIVPLCKNNEVIRFELLGNDLLNYIFGRFSDPSWIGNLLKISKTFRYLLYHFIRFNVDEKWIDLFIENLRVFMAEHNYNDMNNGGGWNKCKHWSIMTKNSRMCLEPVFHLDNVRTSRMLPDNKEKLSIRICSDLRSFGSGISGQFYSIPNPITEDNSIATFDSILRWIVVSTAILNRNMNKIYTEIIEGKKEIDNEIFHIQNNLCIKM
jgi:hypothetical protein